jgi:hypothetical protein
MSRRTTDNEIASKPLASLNFLSQSSLCGNVATEASIVEVTW